MSQCSISGTDLLSRSTKKWDVGQGTFGLVSFYDSPIGNVVVKESRLTKKSLGYSQEFMTEVDILLKLRSLEGIVTIYDMCYDIYGKRGYIMMEPLSDDLKNWSRKVSLETRIDHLETLIRNVGGSLAIMHHFTLIHNDIKPNNILVRIEGDKVTFKLSDFGKSTRVADSISYGGLIQYSPPSPQNQSIYFIEYWAFMIVLLETIVGHQIIRVPSKSSQLQTYIQEFYLSNSVNNKFKGRQFLVDNLTPDQFSRIPPLFWNFIGPLLCCNCYQANNQCNINDGFIAAGIVFNPLVVNAIKSSTSYQVPDQPAYSLVHQEFGHGKPQDQENFRRLINKFFFLDKSNYDNLTIKRYAEVAYIIVMGKRVVSYTYFNDLTTFLVYERQFLSTIGYQIIIL